MNPGEKCMYKNILVTLDGSAISEQALPIALEHAVEFQSSLHLLRVINPLTKSYRTGMATLAAIERTQEQLREMAVEYLESIASNLREKGIEPTISSRIGNTYKEIINYSNENAIDLIVMSTRGESGFTRWMLGSNTDHVIRGTRVPVLVVPASMHREK
jgi:nucleotide-binding universal stress UspA family protein